ncbi:CPBP family intramembrane glutamic endopeptidase [Pseudoxanthomonas beigongshangi]
MQPVPDAGPPPVPPARLRSALAGFGIDTALAFAITFALMMGAGVVWGIVHAIQLAAGGAKEAEIMAGLAQPGALAQILIALFSMGSTALLLYFWRRPATALERHHSRSAVRLPGTWIAVAGVALLTFLSSSAATWLGERLGVPPNPSNLAPIKELTSTTPLFTVAFAVLLAPLYEELLFRRVLFGGLWQAGYPVLGMLLSGLVFALAHEAPGLNGNTVGATVLLLAVYSGMGVAFAWLYRRTGTLWAPIAAHSLNNALALGVLQLAGS